MGNNIVMRKFITESIREYFNESENQLIDFKAFPKDILKTLDREYGHFYQHNFDWNDKADEFGDNMKGFSEWRVKNQSDEFMKNLDVLIRKTRQDLILITRQKNAKKSLMKFEELIVPVLGNSVLCKPLSKFMEYALLHLHSTKEMEAAFQEAESIIDSDGSINQAKITPSELFVGGGINLPAFENFVSENTEYIGVFNDWKKLFDLQTKLLITDLNAYRDSTTYQEIRNLYKFLIDYKNN